ncbi:MAG: heme biosynthesis protein HemY [Alphaproteobacteria bacterium]|nr:heme biosynthesis protein HemY [Alphaproteobacteria bacterium]
MLWSLVKILLFVALVAAITMVAGYVIEAGGEVRISVGSIEFSLTPLAGLIAALLTLTVGWITFRLASLLLAVFRFFNGDETAISRYFDRNRERRGFEALADGLMALASGEGRVAMAKAAKAEKHLNRPDLTLLISAQAAEMSGETRKAQDYYKQLLADDRTRFVGVQGILKQKLAEGDTETALKLAQKAFALRPRHEKTMDVLFSLQSEKQDWKGARLTLSAKLKARALPKDVHTRRDAVLALAMAREKIEAGNIDAGKSAAIEANHLSPDLIPAAVLTAEMHMLQGGVRAANKVLKKAWIAQPHPALAAAWAEIAPNETPTERRARFQPLLKTKPDDPETKMLASELAIVDQDFPGARQAMGDLADTTPTTRSLTIMAAIERGEGAPDNVVRGWLTRALDASRGPQWVCASCNTIHKSWEPVCEYCAHFDTLNWQVPPKSNEAPQHSTDMLPLIVGTIEDQTDSQREVPPAEDEPVTPTKQTTDTPPPPASTPPSESSEDLDGIIGDIHTIPRQPGNGT